MASYIGRRKFLATLGGAVVAWPLAARAQQGERMRRIAVLMNYLETDPEGQVRLSALRDALRKLGWADGGNIRIEYRWGAGKDDRIQAYAAELIGLSPDAIVANSTPSIAVLKGLTRAVPIVFVQVADPVGGGFVASYAQPRGNITGFTDLETSVAGKWIELLKEAAPSADRVVVLVHPEQGNHQAFLRAVETTAASLKIELMPARVRDRAEIEQAITRSAEQGARGLVVLPGAAFHALRASIIQAAARYRLPAIYPYKYYAKDGGLLYYGIDQVEQWPLAAGYVDRILKGEKPADLPVQAPTKYELVINLKTARALSLDVPATLLARADEVFE
jgi:putative tryptophan/tyrosine transport system substrate-binding protein